MNVLQTEPPIPRKALIETQYLARETRRAITTIAVCCGGDGRRAWGDAFSHVVLCGSGFSRDLADDRSKEWMIGSRLVVSGLLFLSK